MTNSFPRLAFSFTFAVFERVRFAMGKSVISHRRNGVWLGAESNRRHEDFQSSALPTELPSRIALPLSRCIERRMLIKAENAQPSTPSCGGGLSALIKHRYRKSVDRLCIQHHPQLDGVSPYQRCATESCRSSPEHTMRGNVRAVCQCPSPYCWLCSDP